MESGSFRVRRLQDLHYADRGESIWRSGRYSTDPSKALVIPFDDR